MGYIVIPDGTRAAEEVDAYWSHGSKKYLYSVGGGQYAHAFGKWVDGLGDWTWFVTRTFARETSPGFTKFGAGAARSSLRDLVRHSEAKTFAACFEKHEDGNYHIHALLGGTRSLDGRQEQERDYVKYGISRWKAYVPSGGAAGYLGKYLTKDYVELYIGMEGFDRELKGTNLGATRV